MDSLSQFIKQREQETLLREKKFPLRCLLLLYLKSPRFEWNNFKELMYWLDPIDIPPLDPTLPHSKYLANYEQQEIARFLKCNIYVVQQTFLSLALENINERT